MIVYQFHPWLSKQDAITNQIFCLQQILKNKGYKSKIISYFFDDSFKNVVDNFKNISSSDDDIILIHHSFGFEFLEDIQKMKGKKVLIYHNITPECFFEDETNKKLSRLGIKQVKELKNDVLFAYANSNYSRKELITYGYKDVGVFPVQVSLNRFNGLVENNFLSEHLSKTDNIIFVGRIAENKKQLDIIKTFKIYFEKFNKNARLYLIGDYFDKPYKTLLDNFISKNNLSDIVRLTGKIGEQDLFTYYKNAAVFLSMSEHEGYGVPLLEAMKLNVPVVAFDSAAVAETMDIGGISFEIKDFSMIAALLDEIVTNKMFANKIIAVQDERIAKLDKTDSSIILDEILKRVNDGNYKTTVQIQGPFETSYSLAIVNNDLARQLDKSTNYDVSIRAYSPFDGDYIPNREVLDKDSKIDELYKKSKTISYPNIVIRNTYPPKASDLNGELNFYNFAWEESLIPEEFIRGFNKYANGIGAISNFVLEKLIECGLEIPVKNTGIVVKLPKNYDNLNKFPLKTKKKIKFLHISSAFPRKGVDVLIEGYYQEFTDKDDVCLVLKTFPNPHNNVQNILNDLNAQFPNHPEIEWINEDLPTEKLYSLYKACSCFVSVPRGEGFGMPVAEAMLAKVPTICTPHSGLKDFVNEETSLCVDFDIARAHSHVNKKSDLSLWFEPRIDSLRMQLRYFVENSKSERINKMIIKAHTFIKENYNENKIANNWMEFIEEVRSNAQKISVALVSTWNSKCGIAEYSRFLYNATKYKIQYEIFPNKTNLIREDEQFVHKRTWGYGISGVSALINELNKSISDLILIQYNYGFFSIEDLKTIILKANKKVIVELHKTADTTSNEKIVSLKSIKDALNKTAKIIVHQQIDYDRLIGFGVYPEKITIIPHGQIESAYIPSSIAKEASNITSKHVVASYGFLLPHKGIYELIEATNILKERFDDYLLILNNSIFDCRESREYYQKCKKYIEREHLENNIIFNSTFQSNESALKSLQLADICVLPYNDTGESASGAARFVAAVKRPLITTKQKIFDEFKDCSLQIEHVNKQEISEAIIQLFSSDNSIMVEKLNDHLKETSWHTIGKKFIYLLDDVNRQ